MRNILRNQMHPSRYPALNLDELNSDEGPSHPLIGDPEAPQSLIRCPDIDTTSMKFIVGRIFCVVIVPCLVVGTLGYVGVSSDGNSYAVKQASAWAMLISSITCLLGLMTIYISLLTGQDQLFNIFCGYLCGCFFYIHD